MQQPIMCSLQEVTVLIRLKSNMSNSTSMIFSLFYVDTDTSKLYGKNMDTLFKSPSLLLKQKCFGQKNTACIRGWSTPHSTQQWRPIFVKYSDIRMRQCNIRLLIAIVPGLSFNMEKHHTDADWKIKCSEGIKKLICLQKLILSQALPCLILVIVTLFRK